MHDERALRRPSFSEGYAVELADGQRWVFPAVRIRMEPDEAEDGSIEVRYRKVYAADIQAELDVLLGVADSTDMEYRETEMKLAARMLRCNYDLPKGAIPELLGYYADDRSGQERWGKIIGAILGRDPDAAEPEDEETDGPKAGPTGAGSDSA